MNWPTGAWPGNGYKRSKSQGTGEQYDLRTDVGANRGVVTVIESDRDVEAEGGERGRNMRKFGSQKTLPGATGWEKNSSEITLPLDRTSAEGEPDWTTGIRKTTVSNQVRS